MRASGIIVLLGFVSLTGLNAFVALPASRHSSRAGFEILQQPANRDESVKTFVGTITKDGDKYVLSDDTRKVWYELDDQQTVSKFNGKKVKVTGKLDVTRNLILIRSIEEATT